MLTAAAAAALLDVTTHQVYTLVRQGKLTPGSRDPITFRAEDVMAYAASRRGKKRGPNPNQWRVFRTAWTRAVEEKK